MRAYILLQLSEIIVKFVNLSERAVEKLPDQSPCENISITTQRERDIMFIVRHTSKRTLEILADKQRTFSSLIKQFGEYILYIWFINLDFLRMFYKVEHIIDAIDEIRYFLIFCMLFLNDLSLRYELVHSGDTISYTHLEY